MVSDTKVTVGDVIKIHNWFGVVLETHFDEDGTLSVIRVQTARNIFRGFGTEYINIRLQPDAIQPAARSDLQQEIEAHQRLLDSALMRMLLPIQEVTPKLMNAD